VFLQVRLSAGLLLILALAGCASRPSFSDYSETVEIAPPVHEEQNAPAHVLPGVTRPEPIISPLPDITGTWVSLSQWCAANRLSKPREVRPLPAAAYSFGNSNGTFILNVGSEAAFWNGLEVRLGYRPQMQNPGPLVHALDLKRTIQPLLFAPPLGLHNGIPVIVVDPGHGGEDSGARSMLPGIVEKDLTLDWARRVASLLATNGWQVWLTRTNDINIPLTNRVALAEASNAALFISLHFNSAGADATQTGLETYCLTPAGLPSNVTRAYADDPNLVFPNNEFDVHNIQLAVRLHRALLRVNGAKDRGVRRARFITVLRGQHRPAVLLEGGYLSNPREAALVAEPAYRQKLAEAVASALRLPPNLATGSTVAKAAQEVSPVRAGVLPGTVEPGIPLTISPDVSENLLP
jgi:N-acetylmuramoyl-L-alanine amidase